MFPLFWLLRNLGGLARWGGVLGGGQGRVGVAEPGKGGRGRGQSQAAPTAPDRTRNSSRTEAGETQKETHTQRDSELHTARKRRGRTRWGMQPGPPDRKWAGVSTPSSSPQPSLPPPLCSGPSVCSVHPTAA